MSKSLGAHEAATRSVSHDATSVSLIPAGAAQHTVESLHLLHGSARPWTYVVALTVTIVALVSLPFIEVDVSVGAPGVIRPATERVELRLPFGGRVGEILARDNATVSVGQPLLVLETADLDERLTRNQAQQREKGALVRSLERLLASDLGQAGAESVQALSLGGDDLPAIRALRQDVAHFTTQVEAHHLASRKASSDYDRIAQLAAKGLVSRRDLEEAEYSLESTRAEARLTLAQARARWQSRLESESMALADLESEAARIAVSRSLAVVRAPVAGTVQGMVGLRPGAILGTEQVVGAISPDDRLVVEALVTSRDIGQVRTGQSVRLQIDAFPYTQWGMVEGRVSSIAADASSSNASTLPVFKVTIDPERTPLRLPNGATADLGKGMTVSARFLTVRRTLLQILYQDASEWVDPLASNRT